MLLKDALTGGARTTVLVCVSPEPRNAAESIQALEFASRIAHSRREFLSDRKPALVRWRWPSEQRSQLQ